MDYIFVVMVFSSYMVNHGFQFRAARFEADHWNKLKNMASKVIGEKMKVRTVQTNFHPLEMKAR